MELRRRSSTPQDAASRAPRFGNSLRIAPRETSGTEGSNPSPSIGESTARPTFVAKASSQAGRLPPVRQISNVAEKAKRAPPDARSEAGFCAPGIPEIVAELHRSKGNGSPRVYR